MTELIMPTEAPSTIERQRAPRRRPTIAPDHLPPRRSGALIFGALALIAGGAVALADLDDGPSPGVVAPYAESGSLTEIADQLGVTEAWAAGITGSGVSVAIVDTGVAPVEALRDQTVVTVDLTVEANDAATAGVDTYGHGTHLAGIVAGNDPTTGFRGIAPDASIVSVKVAGRDGTVQPADLIAGVHWVVDHADQHDVGVLLLAFDAAEATPLEEQSLLAAVERAWEHGIVVVTATGNDGTTGLSAPSSSPSAIAVAAVDSTVDGARFSLTEFSNRGDDARLPDLAAPGAHVISLRAPGSTADVDHPEGYVDAERFLGSGTSQAAAVIAGHAALVLQVSPDATPAEVRDWLVGASTPVGTAAETGAGVPSATDLFTTISADVPWSSSGWSSSGWSSSGWSSSGWSSSGWSSSGWSSSGWS